jgi:hypothetical protein
MGLVTPELPEERVIEGRYVAGVSEAVPSGAKDQYVR